MTKAQDKTLAQVPAAVPASASKMIYQHPLGIPRELDFPSDAEFFCKEGGRGKALSFLLTNPIQ
jgi:hypothetical protein